MDGGIVPTVCFIGVVVHSMEGVGFVARCPAMPKIMVYCVVGNKHRWHFGNAVYFYIQQKNKTRVCMLV